MEPLLCLALSNAVLATVLAVLAGCSRVLLSPSRRAPCLVVAGIAQTDYSAADAAFRDVAAKRGQ